MQGLIMKDATKLVAIHPLSAAGPTPAAVDSRLPSMACRLAMRAVRLMEVYL